MRDRDREQSVGCQTERVTNHHHAHKEIEKTAIPISVEIIKLFTTNVAHRPAPTQSEQDSDSAPGCTVNALK